MLKKNMPGEKPPKSIPPSEDADKPKDIAEETGASTGAPEDISVANAPENPAENAPKSKKRSVRKKKSVKSSSKELVAVSDVKPLEPEILSSAGGFEDALDKVAREKDLSDKLKASIRAFVECRGKDPKVLERHLRLMHHVGVNKDEEKLVDAVSEIVKIMKEEWDVPIDTRKETSAENAVIVETGSEEVKRDIVISGEKKDIVPPEDAVIVEDGSDNAKKDVAISGEKKEESGVPADAEIQKISGIDEEEFKKFIEEISPPDADAIKREIAAIQRNAPKEKIPEKVVRGIKIKDSKKTTWDEESGKRHKMLVRYFQYLKEKEKSGERGSDTPDKVVEQSASATGGEIPGAENAKGESRAGRIEFLRKKHAAGKTSYEETEELVRLSEEEEKAKELVAPPGGGAGGPGGPGEGGGPGGPGGGGPGGGGPRGPGEGGPEAPEPGRELTVTHDRIIAQIIEGRSLAGKKAELEFISSRNPEQQLELELIERAERINNVVIIIAAAEGKNPKEIWREHGAKLFRAYEDYREEFIAREKKEPNVKEFGMKLLEAIPGGGAGFQKLKEKGGEAFKITTDKIDGLFREQDDQKREAMIGKLQGAELMKQIFGGEEGAKNFWQMLGGLRKQREGGGSPTPEEAARARQELEAARSRLEGSAGLFFSVLGMMGLIFLMAVIFTLLVEIEIADKLIKGKK